MDADANNIVNCSTTRIATHHGRWDLELCQDGTVNIKKFISASTTQEGMEMAAQLDEARRSISAASAVSLGMQEEFLKAQRQLTSPHAHERLQGMKTLGWSDMAIAAAESWQRKRDQQTADRMAEENAPPPSWWAKAKSWLRAEASVVTEGKLDDAAFNIRMDACRACEHLDKRDEPQVGFCKACGCGTNSRAELTVKGRMPKATCPKGKWPVKAA